MLYIQLPDYYAFKIHRLYVSVIQLFKNIKNEKMADFKMQLGLKEELNSVSAYIGIDSCTNMIKNKSSVIYKAEGLFLINKCSVPGAQLPVQRG